MSVENIYEPGLEEKILKERFMQAYQSNAGRFKEENAYDFYLSLDERRKKILRETAEFKRFENRVKSKAKYPNGIAEKIAFSDLVERLSL